jgi:hypothetical protein
MCVIKHPVTVRCSDGIAKLSSSHQRGITLHFQGFFCDMELEITERNVSFYFQEYFPRTGQEFNIMILEVYYVLFYFSTFSDCII